ncbi:unnamed protein product [Anisakis simplex]|uniref:Uncharacterized protein n=1 Tax=Anisakis simplex TaxID=6269 RepID=A0A3P6TCY5_ANISI|nr:unnamed protein product [Anisakis simplex]
MNKRSYRPDGSEQYENPRMTRMSLESFRRKRAFENAWKSGFVQYFWMCLMDFLQRFIANPAKVSGSIVGSVAYFVVQGWSL